MKTLKEIAKEMRNEGQIPLDDKLMVLRNIIDAPIGEISERTRWKALMFIMNYVYQSFEPLEFHKELDRITSEYFIEGWD